MTTCQNCDRDIVDMNGAWMDPEATGDDVVWAYTCDASDTFTAEHEPRRTVVIKTIGDVRAFLADFPPEADDYPFIVMPWDDDTFSLVTAHVQPNCDGHPNFAGLVVSYDFEGAHSAAHGVDA